MPCRGRSTTPAAPYCIEWAQSGLAIAMCRTKKPSNLSADERAFLKWIRSLNEEETEDLSFDDIIACLNILDKINPGALRRAVEDAIGGWRMQNFSNYWSGAKERAGSIQ
jgi:hypothetical protein